MEYIQGLSGAASGHTPALQPAVAWSPREYVWLMLLAQQWGHQDLLDQLRRTLLDRECQPAQATWP